MGTLVVAIILRTGCDTEQSVSELHVDDSIRETPVIAFTENIKIPRAIEERYKTVLNQSGNTNATVYSNSAGYYATEGLPYQELLLKRLASGDADDLYTIHAEGVLEFDERGYMYNVSSLKFTGNLSHGALSQSICNEKIFLIPLSYIGFGFIWNADMLKQYGLELSEDLDEFLDVCETLKENGILSYETNRGSALTVPIMCTGLYDVYQNDDHDQKLEILSNGTVTISRYMEKGFDFLQMIIGKGCISPEWVLDTLPKEEKGKPFFTNGNCALTCAVYGGKALRGYPFEIVMTPISILKNGSICIVGTDQRMAINPGSEHLNSVITIVETLGQAETPDSLAKNQGRISSPRNATVPDIPQTNSFIAYIAEGGQIPSQDFNLNFDVWGSVWDLSQQLCRRKSTTQVAAEYDSIQMEEVSKYGN